MSLFQGALDVEKELEALELEKQAEKEEVTRLKEISSTKPNGDINPITFEEVNVKSIL